MESASPFGNGGEFLHRDEVATDGEEQAVGSWKSPEGLQLDTEVDFFSDILRGDGQAIFAPFMIIFRACIKTRIDGHGPVESPSRFSVLDIEEKFEGSFEDAQLVSQGNGSVPLEEVHADIEVERPVCLCGDYSCIHPEISVTLVENGEIALSLTGNILHGAVGQSGGIPEDEGVVDAHGTVYPSPFVAIF